MQDVDITGDLLSFNIIVYYFNSIKYKSDYYDKYDLINPFYFNPSTVFNIIHLIIL